MRHLKPRGTDSELKAFYDGNGHLGPITAFTRSELERMDLVRVVESLGKARGWARNRHLDVPAIAGVCRNESVLSCVRAVLGPNLLLWRSNLFAIGDIGLPWHQDEYRTLLSTRLGGGHCSVQISFTDSTTINTVTLVPGTHRWTDDELRARGYVMTPGSGGGLYGTPQWTLPAATQTLDMPLQAGEFYIFHPRLMHASCVRRRRPDTGSLVRYSIALRIATPDMKVLPAAFTESPARASSVLLAGVNTFGHNRLGTWAH
ncbi:MAG: hypothetical protein NVSMB10_08820 [Steroidobacteraceae bacterium]